MNLWLVPQWDWFPLTSALLHSLWQAGLIGGLLALTLRRLPADRASLRAALSGTAQVAVLLVFVMTWAVTSRGMSSAAGDPRTMPRPTAAMRPSSDNTAVSAERSAEQATHAVSTSRHRGGAPSPAAAHRFQRSTTQWSSLIGIGWLAGAVLMLVRIAVDLAAGRRVVQAGRPVDAALAAELTALGVRLQVFRQFDAVWTDRLSVPAVYGAFRPVLLLPAGMMQVPVEYFEAIVAHELAHLKRLDWFWHMAVRVVEALLFFNPSVWWIGRLARREREAAADALAVAVTRRPVVFARALVEWPCQRSTQAAFGVAWTGDPGSLPDRVMRVLMPAVRPPVRLSPLGLAAMLLAAAITLTGLWSGTQRVVAVAQEILSPAQRIEQIQIVRQEIERPEANPERQPVTVSGTVRSDDGQSLADAGITGYGTVSIHSRYRRGPVSSGGGYVGTVGSSDGKFSASVGDGDITVVVDWEGYAPALVGPLPSSAADQLKDLDVVLSRGFTGNVRLVAPDGEPVATAALKASLAAPAQSQPRHYQVSEDGVVAVTHAAPFPYALTVTAPGYQRQTFDNVSLVPDETLTLVLTPAQPATGTVTDVQGAPIENAELRLFASSLKPGSVQLHGRTAGPLATTDVAGRFRIDTLPDGQRLVVLFAAQGHGSELAELAPGQSDMVVQLGPERMVRGEVSGDLTKLSRRSNDRPTVEYSVRVPLFEGASEFERFYNLGDLAPVEPIEPSADDLQRAEFQLRDLLPGQLTITAGPAKRIIDPFDGLLEQVVIALDEPLSDEPTRRSVVIRFVPPDAEALPPTGDLRLDLKPLGEQAEQRWEQFRKPIDNGQIEVEAFAPGIVSLQNQGMMGYWFDEAVVGSVDNYRAFRVPAGEGPFEFTIPVVPAGAIRGRIVAPAGSLSTDLREINLQCYRGAIKGRGAETITSATVHPNADGEFLITPVPLVGTYYVIADFGVTKVFSESVVVTAAQPVQEVTIQLPELTEATVRVVDRGARPLPAVKVQIARSYPDWFHTSTSRQTNDQGQVTFPDLAADALQQYQVSVINDRYESLVEASIEEHGRETTLTLPKPSR